MFYFKLQEWVLKGPLKEQSCSSLSQPSFVLAIFFTLQALKAWSDAQTSGGGGAQTSGGGVDGWALDYWKLGCEREGTSLLQMSYGELQHFQGILQLNRSQ